jgi:hypothetical protein
MRTEALAARADVAVHWRPFNVRTLFLEQNNIPFRDSTTLPCEGVEFLNMPAWRDIHGCRDSC